MQVAVGRSHAALLTRRGQLYTWGCGGGGRLGHGGAASSGRPLRLLTLWDAVAASVKCSDSTTAAITQVSHSSVPFTLENIRYSGPYLFFSTGHVFHNG